LPTIELDGKVISYDVKFSACSRGRRIAVRPDGTVLVHLPFLEVDTVEDLLIGNKEQILDALDPERVRQRNLRFVEDDEGRIEYLVTRKANRKRVAIFVDPHKRVEVRAPVNLPEAEIKKFVLRQAAWIRERRAEVARLAPASQDYRSGERILYRGEPVEIEVVTDSGELGVALEGKTLRVVIDAGLPDDRRRGAVRTAIRQWLIDQALEMVKERLPVFAERLGVQPRKVTVKDLKSRWGSCSARGNISISFRIVMAPPPVVDYLIVHELCHMIHPNHSKDYWALVESILPEHREHRAWLKAHRLELEL